ncbi:MAG TPA: TIR domain-containing protein [Terriglobia bacterium]|nr:TIR domain-containing protein [Terriglobia bacterium]
MAGINYPPYPFKLGSLLGAMAKTQKRKVYFAFHFDDIMRVNNVRQAWKIDHPDAPLMRSFYDSSLWESRRSDGPESLKNLIRDGVEYTSAVCVLVGSETWSRRWVRYEIARAVIDDRGLLAVHLNNIQHHKRHQPDPLGSNPLAYMGVGKVQANQWAASQYYLFELTRQEWVRYEDYTKPVNLPRYLADVGAGYVRVLSTGAAIYDYVNGEGHRNVGAWIDQAAQQVGR